MKKHKGKQIVYKLHSLDIFPQEIKSKMDQGIDDYLDEVNMRTIKNKELEKKINKLEVKAKKANFIITKKDVDNYLEELKPRFS